MAFTINDFSRKQTTDLSAAISKAIARFLAGLTWSGAGGNATCKFAEVFDAWPSLEDSGVPTSCCVLPFKLVYEPTYPDPLLLEDTWEPKDQGVPGFGLFAVCAVHVDEVEIEIKAASDEERNAALAGVENVFREPNMLLPPSRYGVVTLMDEYFGMPARLALVDAEKIDNADQAAQNVWEAVVTLRVQSKQVFVGPVQPFRIQVVELVEGEPF